MEYDLADKLDLEWHSIFQKHLKHFSYKNKSEAYSFDDILKNTFCPDSNSEHDVKYEDKDIFQKCLIDGLNLLSNRTTFPRQIQIRYLLNIAKYVSKDESCFINLSNTSNVFQTLIYLSQPSTEISTKVLFMEFLCSFLEHPSGVKWLMESKYWVEVLTLTISNQELDDGVSTVGYEILRKLLKETIDMDIQYCEEIMKLLTTPLLNKVKQIKPMVPDTVPKLQELKPTLTCLIEILEGLLKNYNVNVLQYMTNFKVGQACEVILEKTNDMSLCLLLERIVLILAFSNLTVVFDGIKSITQDPLVLSGFIRIINREIDKGLFTVVFELYYYALKYHTYISDKIPKYFFRDKEIYTEDQIVALQLEPLVLEWARLDGVTDLLEEADEDLVTVSHPLHICKNLSYRIQHIGFKLKDKLPACSFSIYTQAVENIARSKNLYSKKSSNYIVDNLVYSLEAPLKYLQSKKNEEVTIGHAHQVYILALLDATLEFIECFNINWPDSVKVLDLLYIVIEGSSAYQWIEPIMLDSLILLQEIISRRISPSMALLIDTADGLKNVGPLLYKTLFTSEWRVRKAVLEVVHTITRSANNCFLSFKKILFDAALPSLVSSMALNDVSSSVRAAALKCLQEMMVMEDIEQVLPKNNLINNVLDIIIKNIDPELSTEAVKLIHTVYKNESHLDKNITRKIYDCLEHVALAENNDANLQMEVLQFWRSVTRKCLSSEGWLDLLFPAVTFSKRIVCLTQEEVIKRHYRVLSELSSIGCLNVFSKYWQLDNHPVDIQTFLVCLLHRFHYTFVHHKVTPESMLAIQDFLDLCSIQTESLISPQESDDILQEIISDTVMKMMPGEMEIADNGAPFASVSTNHLNNNLPSTSAESTSAGSRRTTPFEFVDLVYKIMAKLSFNGNILEENQFTKNEVYIIDY